MSEIKIEGKGVLAAGEYEKIRVDGVCTCTGNIFCTGAEVDGSMKCKADLFVYGRLDCDGMMRTAGNAKAKEADIDGMVNVSGSFETERLTADGSVKIGGELRADTACINGMLKCGGDLNAREIHSEGLISVNGAISADLIDSDGMVCADSIVGDTVNIRSAAGRFVKWIMAKKSTVRLIEATNVTISKLDAETVNGENVTIGPKCRVKTVDCSGNLTIDPTAVVETIVKN